MHLTRRPASRTSRALRRLDDVSCAVGRGLFAGAVGTAAMTLSSTVEMRLRHREASDTPAKAAGKALGVQPRGPAGRRRFSTAVHWAYGTSWGAARGVIGAVGLRGPAAAGAHFAAVWSAELVSLPSLGVAPPPWKWGAAELGVDALHHLVYVTATSAAYVALEG